MFRRIIATIFRRTKAKTAARIGPTTQVVTILESEMVSVGDPVNMFQPMMPPTTAWEVDTGSFSFVIQATVRPTARATVKHPAMALTAPSVFSVRVVPAPLKTAPSTTKMPATIGGRAEPHHAGGHGGPEHVHGVVGPERPPEEDPCADEEPVDHGPA